MSSLQAMGLGIWASIEGSFMMLWSKVASLMPDILVALLVLSLGITITTLISDTMAIYIRKSKVGIVLDTVLFKSISKLTGVKISASHVLVISLRWLLLLTVVISALDLAHMHIVVEFFNNTLGYLPHIIVAALIVVIGAAVADFAESLVKVIAKDGSIAQTAKVSVNIFAFIAALTHLVSPLVNSFSHFVGILSLSKVQGDVLFIGVIVLVMLGCKKSVMSTVSDFMKK